MARIRRRGRGRRAAPAIHAGAVLRPSTTLKLVIRIPPSADATVAEAAVAKVVTTDPPHGARVTWQSGESADGWTAPPFVRWLNDALDRSSVAAFGRPAARVGEGGTIPFLGWLAARFPARFAAAQILALGVLVPGSNHHGSDESLHLPTAERVTGAVAALLVEHAGRSE